MRGAMAIVEREMLRFRRSKALILVSMAFPLLQLVVLAYAFGGTVKGLRLGVVDQDQGLPSVKLQELARALADGPGTLEPVTYSDVGEAVADLRRGRLEGVLSIPPDFSRRVLSATDPHVALVEDNTDGFVSSTLTAGLDGVLTAYNAAAPSTRRTSGRVSLDVVEIYPYVPYIQYLLPGSIVMSIFMMVMSGGAIMFIDDKVRGLHEGYLVTPISRLALIAGFTLSGAMKAVFAGVALTIAGALVAGVPEILAPARLLPLLAVIAVVALALVSVMFLLMVRVNDPVLPRATFGLLNILLYFPSGAIYPQQGFPGWMRLLARVDPFTYAVHALKCLILKDTGLVAVWGDLAFLLLFSAAAIGGATLLFRRTL